MKSKIKKVKVFIDGIDWQYEIGEAADGNKVYPDVDCLKAENRCWEGCGIVECELIFKKWVVEHDWNKMAKGSKSYSVDELKNNSDLIRLESAQKHLEYLEDKVSKQKHKVIEMKANLKKGKK